MINTLIIFLIIVILFYFSRMKNNFGVVDSLSRNKEEMYYRCLIDTKDELYCKNRFSKFTDPLEKIGHLKDKFNKKYSLFRNCDKMSDRVNYYYGNDTTDGRGYYQTKIDRKHGDLLDGNVYDIKKIGKVTAYIPNDNIISCRTKRRFHTNNELIYDSIYNSHEYPIYHRRNYPYYSRNYIHPEDNPYFRDRQNYLYRRRYPYLRRRYNRRYNPFYYKSGNRILSGDGTPIVDYEHDHIGTIKDDSNNTYLLYRDLTDGNKYRYFIKDKKGFQTTIQTINTNVDIYDGHIFKDKNNKNYTFEMNDDSYEIKDRI